MERERWLRLYQLACELSRGWCFGHRYSVACIGGVYLWAVVHDRPTSWACQNSNWPTDLRVGPLPSQPTMSRRLRSRAVQELLKVLENALKIATSPPPEAESTLVIDAKPLPIGNYSKDRDAKWGARRWGPSQRLQALRCLGIRRRARGLDHLLHERQRKNGSIPVDSTHAQHRLALGRFAVRFQSTVRLRL